MNTAGDAAEQIVRMSLNGVEVAAKVTGTAAKELATMIYAILKDQKKTRGKARLASMLRSDKPLKVFAVKDSELEKFCKEAKRYGVLYCVLKDRDANDGLTDIMVKAEDASKINRIFERFRLATVNVGEVKAEIERQKQDRNLPPPDEHRKEEQEEAFLDALMQKAPNQQEQQTENPTTAQNTKSRQSEPISKPNEDLARGTSRPSVREELKKIREEQSQTASRPYKENHRGPEHKHPESKRKRKSKNKPQKEK